MTTYEIVSKALRGYDKKPRKLPKKAWVLTYVANYPGFNGNEEDAVAVFIRQEWQMMKHGDRFLEAKWNHVWFEKADMESNYAWRSARDQRSLARRHDPRAKELAKSYEAHIARMHAAARLGACEGRFEHVRYELILR